MRDKMAVSDARVPPRSRSSRRAPLRPTLPREQQRGRGTRFRERVTMAAKAKRRGRARKMLSSVNQRGETRMNCCPVWTLVAATAGLLTLQSFWVGHSLDAIKERLDRMDTRFDRMED